jgi:hypothetical protein
MAVGKRGLSISAITKHVYNQNCTLFSQPDLQEVRQYVRNYLLRNSKSRQSMVERTERRGYYRLNTNNPLVATQFMLQFKEETPEAEIKEETQPQDLSLDLFSEDF